MNLIKKYIGFIILMLLTLPMIAFAQETVGAVSEIDALSFLIQSIGGMKGASTLAIVGTIVQVVMKALQTPLISNWAGKWKLLLVAGLNMVGGVVALLLTQPEIGIWGALLHSSMLAAISVFGHQVMKQFQKQE